MVAQLPRNDELTIAQSELEEELDAIAESIAPEPQLDYQDALDDLYALAEQIDKLMDIAGTDTQACEALYAQIQQSVKAVATLHCGYEKETIDNYEASFAANGLRKLLIPADFKGCWEVA